MKTSNAKGKTSAAGLRVLRTLGAKFEEASYHWRTEGGAWI
jgi:hypothetical protein